MAALSVAFWKVFGTEDVSGALILNARERLGLHKVIGPIVGQAYFRIQMSAARTFNQLCADGGAEALGAIFNPSVSLEHDGPPIPDGVGPYGRLPMLNWITEAPLSIGAAPVLPMLVPETTTIAACGPMLIGYLHRDDIRLRLDFPSTLLTLSDAKALCEAFVDAAESGMGRPDEQIFAAPVKAA